LGVVGAELFTGQMLFLPLKAQQTVQQRQSKGFVIINTAYRIVTFIVLNLMQWLFQRNEGKKKYILPLRNCITTCVQSVI